MPYRSSKQWSARILSCLFLLTTVVAVEMFHNKQINFLKNEAFSEAKRQLAIVRSRIEAVIVTDMYLLNGMSTQVAIDPKGSPEDWNKIADSIIQDGAHIQLIGIAKDDVLSFVYPLEGNEGILGIDYRDHPEQWLSVDLARQLGQTFISGPFELFQGGWALITRTPIFMDPPFNHQYWGVSSAVISLDSLLKDVGALQLESHYKLAIRGFNSGGKSGSVFYGDSEVFSHAFATEMANFPYGGWYLALSGQENILMDVPWQRIYVVRIIGYSLLVLLALAFLAIYRLYAVADSRAMHDELTMLPNRRYFMYSLNLAFKNAQRHPLDRFTVMNIDLNRFKSINDTYGHAAGDRVLVVVAKRIRDTLRSSDIVARIGGDEFLLLLPRVHSEVHLTAIRNKLEQDINDEPVEFDGQRISLSVSIGWVAYSDQFGDVDELLKAADEKMYQRKRAS
jgi:diguanylate cyclase (GGDEF)-like protein